MDEPYSEDYTENVPQPEPESTDIDCEISPFRAADVVQHMPTGEQWVLACDQQQRHVAWCGWPEGTAIAADCRLMKRASDKERHDMLVTWSTKSGNDLRIRWAKSDLGMSK